MSRRRSRRRCAGCCRVYARRLQFQPDERPVAAAAARRGRAHGRGDRRADRRALYPARAEGRRCPIRPAPPHSSKTIVETKLARPQPPMSRAPQHPDRHGRPAQRNAVSGWAGRLPACAASQGAGRARGALRQQLHRLAALRAGPRLLHERAAAVAHPRLRQCRRIRLATSRPTRIICAPPATTPACPARCISSARTSCTASRSG